MLLLLTQWLSETFSFFVVFKYYTLRAVIAAVTALMIGLLFGPMVIRRLTALKVGQAVRAYGPETHLKKNGTPTMGGVLILVSIVFTTLLWGDLSNRFVWIILFIIVGFGAVGWVDDYRKVVYKNPEGMRSREKFFWLGLVGMLTSFALFFAVAAKNEAEMWNLMQQWFAQGLNTDTMAQTHLLLPFFKHFALPLGVIGFILFSWCVIVGSSNAVNFTDGLDGLAIMPTILVGSALGIFAYLVGSENYATYLLFPHINGATEVMVVCAAIAGAGLAFLWFNAHPAEVFMGDVGALALGGALGTIAVIVRQEVILFVMGGVFVAETLSVMLQVSWFKYTKKRFGEGRRIFRMAPLHHHFEMGGMKETKVVIRFWIVTVVLVLIGLSSLKLR